MDTKSRLSILNKIRKLVLAHHVNVAEVDYAAWAREWDARSGDLLNADRPAFERGVRDLLAGLKSSHTTFFCKSYRVKAVTIIQC